MDAEAQKKTPVLLNRRSQIPISERFKRLGFFPFTGFLLSPVFGLVSFLPGDHLRQGLDQLFRDGEVLKGRLFPTLDGSRIHAVLLGNLADRLLQDVVIPERLALVFVLHALHGVDRDVVEFL